MRRLFCCNFFLTLFAPKVTTVEIRQTNQANSQPATGLGHGPVSYADAVNVAAPAVVNIYTRTLVQQKAPLKDDPFYQQFLERRDTPQRQRIESSLGSGVILSHTGLYRHQQPCD